MKEIVYHGSQFVVERPEFGKGAKNNDYGRGFYCTREIELAREWACGKQSNGYLNKYELELDGLKVLNLNGPEYHILNWLALLTDNRTYWQNGSIAEPAKRYIKENFLIDISGYDVLTGYRANDSYFAFAQDFVSGVISLQKLAKAMRLGNLGEQIVLKSKKAFAQIVFIESETVDGEEYYSRKAIREKEARMQYRKSRRDSAPADLQELFILDIMREGIKNGDSRLF